ncbi:hypothetical protein FTX61_13535 [Nitriliruptoraceae bacterium ZYF776]|nr:hypothetical protein [Profundirhabdus halotolerans]
MRSATTKPSCPGAARPAPRAPWPTPTVGCSPERQANPSAPPNLSRRLAALGIQARAARHAALLQLARDVPAADLADTLNIDVTTATTWAARSGATWNNYAATRVNNAP